jgi:hypothetical protein
MNYSKLHFWVGVGTGVGFFVRDNDITTKSDTDIEPLLLGLLDVVDCLRPRSENFIQKASSLAISARPDVPPPCPAKTERAQP